ncbi:MAG: preprotein translocase subunit SecA [Candidatus Moranbacteria bacterium RIFOXYA12_FULL_35_19]|nr:MAG: preprotein translocase subunit SecA [Candidatus Moranbacteria bacterium RIFOXYB12_FULL_35_8]OGI32701.1 MAG: preprotein translocase subunit SecA [Candidatus Moranbacteria bacterium RIFOXYC12_FULL_36_13]OGI36697.1 MAG: preprotein translocase subunit SecA [Candidatus Moranbacteria bacterium RIFOXYA12_FULL_35_19]
MSIISKLFGSNEKEVARTRPIVEKINSLEAEISKLSDEELRAKTEEFKKRIEEKETLDEILPEAFAVVREAVKRVDNKRLFDVQMTGGIILHQGRIAEMKTGEGKTHTALLPMYLNALTGKGVHIVTVNDYLAKRDCNWMGGILYFLGISTACIIHDTSYIYEPKIIDENEVSIEMQNLKEVSRRDAYNADITYGTNNEFGFDYLRDNMVHSLDQMAQARGLKQIETKIDAEKHLNFAIVDEVDSILIDEARTPLIISAPDSESTKMYQQFASLVPRLKRGDDFEVDEKMKAVSITDSGISKIEDWLGMGNIYEAGKINYVHHLEQALKAQIIFERDRDYVVKDGEVIIVDDFTGRLMPGRRYSEGLHQAIEAKEKVQVQKESRTLATITFQNYFRMYNKLSGMTGTASTSAEEFHKVYNIDVVEIPTNKPLVRKDLPDIVYKSEKGKFNAICERIKEINKIGQPVLVGTIAIEKSEYLSALLTRFGVKHEVLNAKQHEKEALIIQNAGQKGSVTIATNMAGRGTDIKLGEGVKDLGGLFILGTERHEARRIDNQLRGRAGRQGDPGMSQFFVSLEDELMRRFGGDKLINMMNTLGLPEDQPIQNKIISRTIENAQSKIEGFNFDIRKHVLEYDDVMNKQREVIYKKRKEILGAPDLKNEMLGYISQEMENLVSFYSAEEEKFQTHEIYEGVKNIIPAEKAVEKKLEEIKNNNAKNSAEKISAMTEYLIGLVKEAYNKKEQEIGSENMRSIEKMIILQTMDMTWMNHLDEMDYLRDGIGLRGYGQRDPLIEYKKEAYHMFSQLLNNIRSSIVRTIFKVSLVAPKTQETSKQNNLNYSGGGEVEQFSAAKQESKNNEQGSINNKQETKKLSPIINNNKVGRNDPCPCGSGKKYKKCCGK